MEVTSAGVQPDGGRLGPLRVRTAAALSCCTTSYSRTGSWSVANGLPWPDGLIAMYLVSMDQMAREEISAATAAHRELGPGYDQAVAEGLAERLGSEIDKRVDARLAYRSPAAPTSRPSWVPVVIGAGSMVCGVAATGIVLFATATNINGRFHNTVDGAQILLVALIWAVIAIVNIAYARRR